LVVDVNDGHVSGRPGQSPQSVAAGSSSADAGTPVQLGLAEEPTVHPRLQAMIIAGRYHGMELDPNEFRGTAGDKSPSARSLSSWAQGAGMWARAVRLRWRHLLRFHNSAPVVLLFNDGTAGLLTGVNTEHNVVFIKDPAAPAAEAPVPVDELRLNEVWSGDAVLVRAARGFTESDAPFSLRWLAGLVFQEKRSLRDIACGSLALSILTIFPPFLIMTVIDKVLSHNS
jgi:subfamily B ATP-binding cassette protein HlyB/CyaB